MKIIRSIITILLTLSLCLCTFGAEAAEIGRAHV